MSELSVPEAICVVEGCNELVAVTPRAPAADGVVDAPAGELLPLCARHAEQADEPQTPPTT